VNSEGPPAERRFGPDFASRRTHSERQLLTQKCADLMRYSTCRTKSQRICGLARSARNRIIFGAALRLGPGGMVLGLALGLLGAATGGTDARAACSCRNFTCRCRRAKSGRLTRHRKQRQHHVRLGFLGRRHWRRHGDLYDQWEDGYETDLAHPVQATTRVWATAMTRTGIHPASRTDPIGLPAGTVADAAQFGELPRNPSTFCMMRADRLAATKALVVSRSPGRPHRLGDGGRGRGARDA